MKKLLILVLSLSALAAAQTTPNLGLNVPPPGQLNWGVLMNQNMSILDAVIGPVPPGGIAAVSVPVESFGAIGDWNGTTGTDNTAAIQACLNSLTAGVCVLGAKAYKITGTLTINKSSVGLIGTGSTSGNTSVFSPVPPVSTLVSTSASADMIDVAGAGGANTLGNNFFRNFNLNRAVLPSGTARGLSVVFTYGTVIEYVTVQDSIQNFYFRGVGSAGIGRIENCQATWGENGLTETAGNYYGFFVDSAGGTASPSIRFRNNASSSTLGASPVTYGLVATGTLPADLHSFHQEAFGTNYGIYVNSTGVASTSATDMHFLDSVNDSCLTTCISINGVVGTVSVIGGWSNQAGNPSTPAIDIENSSNVKIASQQVFDPGAATVGIGVLAHNSTNTSLIGNTFLNLGGGANPVVSYSGTTTGQVVGNSFYGSGSTITTVLSLVGSSDITVAANSFEETATNAILVDSNSHRIGGLETNTCGTVAVITNCIVDSGGNGLSLPPQAFANLATCIAALEGKSVAVNNSNTATYNAVVAGGGANHIVAYCNGTAWVAH